MFNSLKNTKMKKILLFAISLAFTTTIFSQNLDFEDWTQDTILHLDNYMSTTDESAIFGEQTVIRFNDHTDGLYSLMLKTVLTPDNDTILGYFSNGDPDDLSGGHEVNLNSIDSVIGYYKYDIQPNDTALFLCIAKYNQVPTGGEVFTITGTQTNWTRFAYPIGAVAVDSVIIAAASSNAINNIGITPGSYIIFDDIQLKSGATLEPIQNHSFENWSNIIWEDLTEWNTTNKYIVGIPTLPVEKTTDSYSGTYACSIQTQFVPQFNDTIEGFISYGQWTMFGPIGGFPYSDEPESVRFYYKNSLNGIDTASVSIAFKNNANVIAFNGVEITDDHLSYTLWEQPVNLPSTPDTVFIAVTSGKNPGSQFIIDIIEFVMPVGISDTYKINEIVAFPNPAKDKLNFKFNTQSRNNININIYSLNGKLLLTHNYNSISNNEEFSMDISTLTRGNYIYKISIDDKNYSKKFIKN